jgi:hypothetical protein
MQSKSQKIILTIEQLIDLLKLSEGTDTEYYYGFFVYTLGQLKRPHDLHKIAENILKAYGGMDTFSDVAIYQNGEPLTEEHLKFSRLRTKLFTLCEDVIEESRGA